MYREQHMQNQISKQKEFQEMGTTDIHSAATHRRSPTTRQIPVPSELRNPIIPQTIDDSFWAWTAGDERPITEASWAFEVVKTICGRMSIGIASAEKGGELIPNMSVPVLSSERKNKEEKRKKKEK